MKKVLVAEDEQNIREFVVINLERAGYEVTEAESGDQALELYGRGGDFHVVILDIMMPGEKDGLAVCRELRSRNPSLGIILLTAKTQEMDKVSGLMMGADDYDKALLPLGADGQSGRGVPAGGPGRREV
jgi:DNA-binding response OmpR family regulator